MKGVELYARFRYPVRIEGIGRREAARRFGIDPRTVAEMLSFSLPPGYRRSRPSARPKLDPFVGITPPRATHPSHRRENRNPWECAIPPSQKAPAGAFWHSSLTHFYAGPPMHFLLRR